MSNKTIRGLKDGQALTLNQVRRPVEDPFTKFINFMKEDGAYYSAFGGPAFLIWYFEIWKPMKPIHLHFGTHSYGYITRWEIVAFAVAWFALCFGLHWLFNLGKRWPMRIPRKLKKRDPSTPDPRRRGKYLLGEGIYNLGRTSDTGEEIWANPSDLLTHTLVFGTTGAGKSEALISMADNALMNESGLIYIDPKGSEKLIRQIYALALKHGRKDDFRVLNFSTSGPPPMNGRRSHTWNPFAHGNGQELHEMLCSLMVESSGEGQVFAAKGQMIVRGVMSVLADMRDAYGLAINPTSIYNCLSPLTFAAFANDERLSIPTKAVINNVLKNTNYIPGNKDQKEFLALRCFKWVMGVIDGVQTEVVAGALAMPATAV